MVPALRIALAIAAAWALRRELSGVHVGVLLGHLGRFGAGHIALALACTVGSFLVLGIVELLALRRLDGVSTRRVPVRAALVTAFIANALSQSVGLAMLTGAATRARAYARYGLDAVAIAQVTTFVTLTATSGLLAAGSVALLTGPPSFTIADRTISAWPLGMLLGVVVFTYLAWSIFGRVDSIGYRRWRLGRPSPRLASGQLLLSAADWLFAGGVLFAFMPSSHALAPATVLGAFMIAQTIAVTSHVPAGAGVLEVVVLTLLAGVSPSVDRAAVVAALVMFRVIYYLLPLCAAMVSAVILELLHARRPSIDERKIVYRELGARRAG